MSYVHCPLCGKRISDWMMSAGKCVTILSHTCHKSCVNTIEQAEEAIRRQNGHDTTQPVSFKTNLLN